MAIVGLFLIIGIFASNINADQKVEHKIAVLVNESEITSYDIIQRMKLTAITQGININEQNNQSIVNNVVDELIREKVKIDNNIVQLLKIPFSLEAITE